ncbi:MmpS family transport accessory protein [Micromonospora narathiwatensis]|uniref:Membrane protein n=1 Tax=Micromonospora narathiwatensis TaxID=299146 RepID=A0A1A9A5A1_9ACTN|nr:MmpS family transport accessory protein [Micromonospora narathiwatensis]SBT51383.1 membrane protein [Micromonospora narathiwatensis]
MSEATPSPDPQPGGSPTDPTASPAVPTPAPWTPPDPLAAPTPWAPSPMPWSPVDESGTTGPPGATGLPGTTGVPGVAGLPGAPAPTGYPAPTGHPAPTGPAGPLGGPVPAPGATPPPGHPWPGHPTPAWPPASYPPPYAYPGPPPPANGGRTAAIVVGIVIAVLALVFCGCVGLGVLGSFYDEQVSSSEPYEPGYGVPDEEVASVPPNNPATTPSGGPGSLTVTYEVTGGDSAYIQFYDANGDFFQVEDVQTPWRMAFTANDRERVQIIASPTQSGEVSCKITINGKVVSQNSGENAATCFGW